MRGNLKIKFTLNGSGRLQFGRPLISTGPIENMEWCVSLDSNPILLTVSWTSKHQACFFRASTILSIYIAFVAQTQVEVKLRPLHLDVHSTERGSSAGEDLA